MGWVAGIVAFVGVIGSFFGLAMLAGGGLLYEIGRMVFAAATLVAAMWTAAKAMEWVEDRRPYVPAGSPRTEPPTAPRLAAELLEPGPRRKPDSATRIARLDTLRARNAAKLAELRR
jgi:hypothetical protein